MSASLDEYTDVRPLATFDEEWKSTGPNATATSISGGGTSSARLSSTSSVVSSIKTPSTRMPSESKYAVDEGYEYEDSKVCC